MNYTLAKQLKDAGYLQRMSLNGHYVFENTKIDDEGNLITSGEAMQVPSLSELIEACGEEFGGLEHNEDGTFYVYEYTIGPAAIQANLESTPEEAVAKLWLALNTYDEEGNKLNKNPIVIKEGKGLF